MLWNLINDLVWQSWMHWRNPICLWLVHPVPRPSFCASYELLLRLLQRLLLPLEAALALLLLLLLLVLLFAVLRKVKKKSLTRIQIIPKFNRLILVSRCTFSKKSRNLFNIHWIFTLINRQTSQQTDKPRQKHNLVSFIFMNKTDFVHCKGNQRTSFNILLLSLQNTRVAVIAKVDLAKRWIPVVQLCSSL